MIHETLGTDAFRSHHASQSLISLLHNAANLTSYVIKLDPLIVILLGLHRTLKSCKGASLCEVRNQESNCRTKIRILV